MRRRLAAHQVTAGQAVPVADGAEPAVLALAAERFGLTVLERLGTGGSDSICALARDATDRLVVVKCLRGSAGRVDGHGLGTFRAKQRQQELLTAVAPGVGDRYATLLRAEHGRGWSAYVLEHCPYPPLVDTARQGDPAVFSAVLRAVLGSLIEDGYTQDVRPAPATLWPAMYLGRLARRRWILRRHLPADLWDSAVLEVNGRRVGGLDEASSGADAPAVRALFADSRLSVPVHGDLNLRNLLADPAPSNAPAYCLIDPRGTTQPWDVVYDLAKMLFTLTLFDDTMRAGFTVTTDRPGVYTVGLARPGPLQRAAAAFVGMLPELWQWLRAAGLGNGPWLERLLFAHATHVLAESACRLSDRADPLPVRLNRALGLHLYGLLLMTDLLERFRDGADIDITAHLALTGVPPV
ncbi:phosphotransferase [Streptomyces mirabilis]|uniref:phosphotransferase n=1 Tax=Streptomyces mirabilis TaxID=68239 RepID=UPI0007661C17|nr:phosphotransferase [Streptomyces mirabilis]MCX4428968.1 phosphotransferase [Streptomyces mirabilis]